MALIPSVENSRITQHFGLPASGVASLEPSMWETGDKAYWLWYPNSRYRDHFHPGIDRAAPAGTNVQAMEDGTVTFSGWSNNIDGYKVEVEIRPGTRFAVNHLAKTTVRVGDKIQKGQRIGLVGSTGWSTGPHTHEGLSIQETDAKGITRTFLWNSALFMSGGPLENDKRVRPEAQFVKINGPGINIRFAPPDFDDASDIFAVSRETGIYKRNTGRRLSGLHYKFRFIRWRNTEWGKFAIVTGYRRRLAIHKSLIRFV